RPARLADIAGRAVEIAQPLLDERRHHFSAAVPSDLWVDADRVRLAQVLANLLTNAAKFTDPGGTIALEAAREGDDVGARGRDAGAGIDPALLPRIFDSFGQPSARGLGIGLALVKTLVELHGGSVAAESAGPGRGSTFTVRLPALPPEAARSSAPPVD